MVEVTRSIKFTVEIDTNKQTIHQVFEGESAVRELLEWLEGCSYIDWYELSSEGFRCGQCWHGDHEGRRCQQVLHFGKQAGETCDCVESSTVP